MKTSPSCYHLFSVCSNAIRNGKVIHRANRNDKEFHFQNWFQQRLADGQLLFNPGGRNSYPDFTLVNSAEGYEVKGLAYPGRESTYDSNSQAPTGLYNGRTIYYVFGRYPADVIDDEYPVIDFVLCHGDFLNVNHEYVHKNKSVKGFGSYGDIMIRDRKMYVVPTPYALVSGTSGQHTLIVPKDFSPPSDFELVGDLVRAECAELVAGYSFDLLTNTLTPKLIKNKNVGKRHHFCAYRLKGIGEGKVSLIEHPRLESSNGEEEA